MNKTRSSMFDDNLMMGNNLNIDECIEKIEEYLGDLTAGTPPDPPSLAVCKAIYSLIDNHKWEARVRRGQEWADRLTANYGPKGLRRIME